MSPVFRHGLLRLYLLKLLDEAPRHGYDVIRLLQDRFLGVYSPSPGTIYPRLARLEEEGLVTHDVIDGKKVYRITDAGRDELNSRLDDLADLEDQLSASVRDIAREISRDVRETVRNLRDELTWAVREAGRTGREATNRDQASDRDKAAGERSAAGSADDACQQARRRPPADWREWANWREWATWAERPDWREWATWARQQDWSDWAGMHEWREQARTTKQDWREQAQAWKGARRAPDRDLASDLDHLAGAFATQIRGMARHVEAISDDAVISLGRILGDALSRITTEVFGPHTPPAQPEQPEPPEKPEPPESHGTDAPGGPEA